jgi:S1-C subfamily serine protease
MGTIVDLADFFRITQQINRELHEPISTPAAAGAGRGEPATLGISPDLGQPGGGVRVLCVSPSSPAARAGILPGGLIKEIGYGAVEDNDGRRRDMDQIHPSTVSFAMLRSLNVKEI